MMRLYNIQLTHCQLLPYSAKITLKQLFLNWGKRKSVAALAAGNTAQNSTRAAAAAAGAVNSCGTPVMPSISGADGDEDKDQTAPTTLHSNRSGSKEA